MKTLKTTLFNKALLSTALLAVIAAPAMATEPKKTKEIKELVGYNVTETTEIQTARKGAFLKIDRNNDGFISAKELRNGSNLENSYEEFLRMDVSGDKKVNLEEFATFRKTKGNTTISSELHGKVAVKGTNLKSRSYVNTTTRYEPVEPTVVEVKAIEPAAE
jgi:hypothetical protein